MGLYSSDGESHPRQNKQKSILTVFWKHLHLPNVLKRLFGKKRLRRILHYFITWKVFTKANSVRFLFSFFFQVLLIKFNCTLLVNFKLHLTVFAKTSGTSYLNPKVVRFDSRLSGTISTKTRAPQGAMLSHFLTTLYTADYRHSQESCLEQKFSNDTALKFSFFFFINKGDNAKIQKGGLKSVVKGKLEKNLKAQSILFLLVKKLTFFFFVFLFFI